MKLIRFDSVGGASGDMILGALIGLGADLETIKTELEKLLPGHFSLEAAPCSSHGISGLRATVKAPEHHHHHHHHDDHHHDHHAFREIRALIEESHLPAPVKKSAVATFALLAEVEGKIHGKAPEEVSFHEIGAIDSIVDIAGCALGFHLLGIEAISVSPLPTGTGTLKCAHGVMPIPAPATAELLTRGLEIAPCDEPFELLTPTGAALLAGFKRIPLPVGARVLKVANSFGQRELNARPNLLRAMLLETAEQAAETLEEYACNLDDCPGEITGFLLEELLKAGALDAWIEPIQMKKNRPGVKLCVLAEAAGREKLLNLIFRESTTLGIRITPVTRRILSRTTEKCMTQYGEIAMKVARDEKGAILSVKPEFEECRRIALESGVPVKNIIRDAVSKFPG